MHEVEVFVQDVDFAVGKVGHIKIILSAAAGQCDPSIYRSVSRLKTKLCVCRRRWWRHGRVPAADRSRCRCKDKNGRPTRHTGVDHQVGRGIEYLARRLATGYRYF